MSHLFQWLRSLGILLLSGFLVPSCSQGNWSHSLPTTILILLKVWREMGTGTFPDVLKHSLPQIEKPTFGCKSHKEKVGREREEGGGWGWGGRVRSRGNS